MCFRTCGLWKDGWTEASEEDDAQVNLSRQLAAMSLSYGSTESSLSQVFKVRCTSASNVPTNTPLYADDTTVITRNSNLGALLEDSQI